MFGYILRYVRKVRLHLLRSRSPVKYAREIGVKVGDNCRFIGIDKSTFGSEPYLITIGNYVSITGGVRFITHDGGVWVFRGTNPDIDVIKPIKIGNNVFIGINVVLMPGVNVGDNCVIGAGSVVTKDIPADSVFAGVPARFIKTIADYWEGVSPQVICTKSLTRTEKKNYLIDKYIDMAHGA